MQKQSLAKLAGMLCNQPVFMQFCGATSAQDAADFVRRTCGVKSRAELDHNPEAAKRFHESVRIPFAYGAKS